LPDTRKTIDDKNFTIRQTSRSRVCQTPTTSKTKQKYAFLVCGCKGFDTSMNTSPPLGARLVSFDGSSLENGKWTLEMVTAFLNGREMKQNSSNSSTFTLSFRNDPLSCIQRELLSKEIISDEKHIHNLRHEEERNTDKENTFPNLKLHSEEKLLEKSKKKSSNKTEKLEDERHMTLLHKLKYFGSQSKAKSIASGHQYDQETSNDSIKCSDTNLSQLEVETKTEENECLKQSNSTLLQSSSKENNITDVPTTKSALTDNEKESDFKLFLKVLKNGGMASNSNKCKINEKKVKSEKKKNEHKQNQAKTLNFISLF